MALNLSRTQVELDGLGVGVGGKNAPGKTPVNVAEAVATDEVGEAWLEEGGGLLD